jgi:D-amino-acid dehydrogenase
VRGAGLSSFTVLGAGIVGVCSALALQREGHSVTLVDRDEPGKGCSFGNAGILHAGGVLPLGRPGILGKVPGMLLDPEGALVIRLRHLLRLAPWFARMVAASRPSAVEQASRALAPLALGAREAYAPLLRDAEARHLVKERGELYAYRTKEGFDAEARDMEVRKRLGVPVETLDAAQLRDMEPAISPEYRYAHYQPASAYVSNPYRLVQALTQLFVRNGGHVVRQNVRLASELAFENLVICAGAFSRPFAAAFGADVPLQTWRGYHIMVAPGSVKLNGLVVDGDMHFAVTPMEEGIRVAGLIEFASLEAPPNYARADLFVKLARRLIPSFPSSVESRWMGHRPGTPDSLPVIGRSPAARNVFFNFGHGTLGLTFGAISAQILADIVAGRRGAIDATPYRAERFLSSSRR